MDAAACLVCFGVALSFFFFFSFGFWPGNPDFEIVCEDEAGSCSGAGSGLEATTGEDDKLTPFEGGAPALNC